MPKKDGGAPEKKAKAFKAQGERVRESINLITQLVEYGIPADHYHLAELREFFNKWIRDPEYSFVGKLSFEAFDKKLEVMLPRAQGAQASVHLRSV